MFLSNLRKSFIASGLLLIGFSSCWLWQKNDDKPTPLIIEEKGEFPFSTREPEVFQCNIVTTAEDISQTYFYARKQGKWRYDLRHGEEDQVSNIHTDKHYLISYRGKIYAEVEPGKAPDSKPSPLDDLTNRLLKRGERAEFEEIGRENNLTKFRVRTGDSNASEIIIFVDPAVGLPVKQEFYSVVGDKKSLGFSVELRDLNLDVDDSVFAIPAGFRKVSIDEFRKAEKAK